MAWFYEIVWWLNENQGAVMAVLTAVYVIATIVIVLASRSTVRSMQEANKLTLASIGRAEAMEQERNRPYVILDLIVRGQFFYASLKNYGQRPAFDVRCSAKPKLIRFIGGGKRGPISFVANEVPVLVPGRQILDLVGETSEFLRLHEKDVFDMEVSYRDSQGNRFREKCSVSVGHYMDRMRVYDEGSLKKVEKHLESVARELRSLRLSRASNKHGTEHQE